MAGLFDTAFNDRREAREAFYRLEDEFYEVAGVDLVPDDGAAGPVLELCDGEIVKGWAAALESGRRLLEHVRRQMAAA